MDYLETVKELMDKMAETDLGELEVTADGVTIKLKAKKCLPPPPAHPAFAMSDPVAVAVAEAAPAPAVEAAPEPEAKGELVTAPLVGTYYAAPAPEQPPFVKVGDTVAVGDVICIIESMKLMNEVQSDFAGRVTEILVENGQGVEFGQPLIRIE